MIPDMFRVSRGKAMPAAKFSSTGKTFLPSSIFYQTITGNYAELDIAEQWTEVDLVLRPDMATACAAPWAEELTLQGIHDVRTSIVDECHWHRATSCTRCWLSIMKEAGSR
jgi:glutamine synthetase